MKREQKEWGSWTQESPLGWVTFAGFRKKGKTWKSAREWASFSRIRVDLVDGVERWGLRKGETEKRRKQRKCKEEEKEILRHIYFLGFSTGSTHQKLHSLSPSLSSAVLIFPQMLYIFYSTRKYIFTWTCVRRCISKQKLFTGSVRSAEILSFSSLRCMPNFAYMRPVFLLLHLCSSIIYSTINYPKER